MALYGWPRPSCRSAAGLCYTFSLFSPSLKTAFDFTQPQLETLGSCLLSGGYFGLIPGFLYDALRHYHKFGPRFGALLSCQNAGMHASWVGGRHASRH